MPKIKLIIIDGYTDYDGDWRSHVVEGISDWEDVSDEDYQYIRSNLFRLDIKNGTPVLIRQDEVPIYERIKGIKKAIKAQEDRIKKQEEERKAKAAEAAAKRRAKKLAKDTDALQRLAKENPELFKELAVAING